MNPNTLPLDATFLFHPNHSCLNPSNYTVRIHIFRCGDPTFSRNSSKSTDHKIVQAGRSGDLLSNLLLQAGSAVGSDGVAQGFIRPGLENLPQTVWTPWAACSTAWHPHGEKVSLYIRSEPLMSQLVFIVSCPPTCPTVQSLDLSPRWLSHKYWWGGWERGLLSCPLMLSLLQAK